MLRGEEHVTGFGLGIADLLATIAGVGEGSGKPQWPDCWGVSKQESQVGDL